jgi:biotin synthase
MNAAFSIQPDALAEKSLRGEALSREEARAVLHWAEDDLLSLVQAAFRVRRAAFGKKVKLNYLVNLQSGLCPEDCTYCSQSKVSEAPIEKYRLMSPDEVVAAAERAIANKARRVCMVASMRGPSDRDVASVSAAVERLKAEHPEVEVCACLGLLKDGQAEKLKDAGVHAYNHNLNTSERHYASICHTHTFADRVDTVEKAKAGGLSACSGALFGMGETEDDVLDVAYRLRDLGVDSVPVNFLIPIKGTPLSGTNEMTPQRCLKILCLFRFLHPATEIRIAGGRELHLRSLQPLGLYVANSLFVGDYLTTEGQAPSADIQMIRDMGFEILGEDAAAPAPDVAGQVTFTSRELRSSK